MTDENIQKKVDESWKDKAKNEPKDTQKSEEEPKMPAVDFKFLLTTFGMQAWIALGAIPNPMTQKSEENLPQAKFMIDSLEVLDKKTKGNLDKNEAELLENMLYELRSTYINKTMKTS